MKFISYKCEFVGKIDEIHILIKEKLNREIPGFFTISRPKIEPGSRELNPNSAYHQMGSSYKNPDFATMRRNPMNGRWADSCPPP